MSKEKIIDAIEHTGFVLEYFVYSILRENNWRVINNRYYLDDSKGTEREIDAIAYKAMHDTDEDVLYYTVLIISCKKTKDSMWVFLTHDIEENDPNYEFCPIENFSTDKRLTMMLIKMKEYFTTEVNKDRKVKKVFNCNHKIFAFQQINGSSFRTEDNNNIYNSIITSIKALEYEKNIRNNKDNSAFYNFNLISVFEGDMKEMYFHDQSKEVFDVDEIKYINRHIVNKEENFYKVHFIRKKAFKAQIDNYNELHKINCTMYPKLINAFYNDIFSDQEKADLLWRNFVDDIKWWLNLKTTNQEKVNDLWYTFNNDILNINIDGHFEDLNKYIESINNDNRIKQYTAKFLLKHFRYAGAFAYDDGLPF